MGIEFDITPVSSSIIMVAGIGGGGGNAVNHLYKLGTANVSFLVCNTDAQALDRSPVPNKILLGDGLGAGNKPERARAAAMDSTDEIKNMLTVNGIKMLFVTAGMGGGTGTGAAPVVARIAKDMDILTVGIVSIPFQSEGPKRVEQAVKGIEELSHCVDSLIVINNEHIAQIHGKLGISQALAKADDILAMAAKSIADIITAYAVINVDFADVTTVMKDSGVALMGSATGGGEDRALEVAKAAINSPLLHHNSIKGAKNVLLNITSGADELSFEESKYILDYIQDVSQLDNQTDVIWGSGRDEALGNDIQITVVATGFDVKNIPAIKDYYRKVLEPGKKPDAEPKGASREIIDLDTPEPVAKKPTPELDNGGFEVVTRTVERDNQQPRVAPVDEPRAENRAEPTLVETRAEGVVVTPIGQASENTMIDVEDATIDTPAWMRRRINLYNEPRNPSVRRENLGNVEDSAPNANQTVSLFD